MIVVLLAAAGLLFGGLGLGIYLLFRPDPPEEEADRPPPVESSRPAPAPRPTSQTAPGPGSGTGSGSTAIERPGGSAAGLREVAEEYVTAVNGRDEAAATALTCQETDPGTLFSVTEGREVRLGEVEVIEGSVASATVRVGDGETALLLENREDGWCVAI
jgi:hypothetical protein